MQDELILFRKISTLLTLETSKWIVSRPTCLRMEGRSDSNHFKLHVNRLFVFVFKCLRSLRFV